MKKLNENLSSEKLVYGLIIFFILFLGVVNYDLNKNISATDDIVSETIINGYKQSNNKYCSDTLKSLLGSNLLPICLKKLTSSMKIFLPISIGWL